MYQIKQTILQKNLWHHFVIYNGATLLSYADVLQNWQHDNEFRRFFITTLQKSDFSAFRWETAPLTFESRQRTFEFVLHNTPNLAPHAEPAVFAEHFATEPAGSHAIAFPNLGKNAILVVPTPQAAPQHYRHLASFSREAPIAQQEELWKLVARQMLARLSDRPVWLSTAGGGVSWLHVRLDDRPKYYGHQPYRIPPAENNQ